MNEERGKINNKERATQLRDFSGLRFKNMTPTDIDGLLEYENICYVFFETKFENAPLPAGQKLALQRLCDDMSMVKPTISVISSHNSPIGEVIDTASTIVSEFRFRGNWCMDTSDTTLRELMARFIGWVENNG